MFDRIVVQKAMNSCWKWDTTSGLPNTNPDNSQSSVTSLLIYDIFGGEILKSPQKKGWHFYNRIDGECMDFTELELSKSPVNDDFEDLPSTPDETYNYFDEEEYSTLFTRFIRAYEEAVGLKKYSTEVSA